MFFLQESKFLKFLGFMWNPLSWVMEAAAIMAIVLANGGVSIFYTLLHIFICFFKVNSFINIFVWSVFLIMLCLPGEAS